MLVIAGVRRAFLIASGERYARMGINLVMLVVVARLLTPVDFGISVLGSGFLLIADELREVGTASYLIQKENVATTEIRTAFTVIFLVTLVLTAVLILAAPRLATFYSTPELQPYLYLVAATFLVGPFPATTLALLRRDLAFGTLAVIRTVSALVLCFVTIILATLGFRYLSLGWGALAGATTNLILGLYYRPAFSGFVPSLREWRGAARFAGYDCVTILLNRACDLLPYIVFGRTLGLEVVGMLRYASTTSQLPERMLLSSVGSVALPVFSAALRNGHALKQLYFGGIAYITAVYWPALALLAILAHPIVQLLFGQQWEAIVPLVQIMSCAWMFSFPTPLTYPVLIAVGAVRNTLAESLAGLPISAFILILASLYGLRAVVLSMLLTLPLQACVALYFVRRQIPFTVAELAGAVAKSCQITVLSVAGPLVFALAMDLDFRFTLPAAAVIAGLAVAGWLTGIWLTQHRLLEDIKQVVQSMVRIVGFAGKGRLAWWHDGRSG